jgi:prepilin-type N-terminal cleavage/methylation domain-containing protein
MTLRTRNAGFSLIEVMIAILILGVAVVGLTQGLTTALTAGKDSENQTQAAMLAAGQIETLRTDGMLEDGDDDGDFGDDFPSFQWKQTIKPAGIDGLHEVTVTVENANTGQSIYELKTLLFEAPADTESSTTKTDAKKKKEKAK